MDESRTILEESANKLFAGFAEPALLRRVEAGEAAPEVWAAIEAMGFELIFSGASDDPWRDAAVILKACGRHVLPAPLPETLMTAALMQCAGLESLPVNPKPFLPIPPKTQRKSSGDSSVAKTLLTYFTGIAMNQQRCCLKEPLTRELFQKPF